MMVVVAAMVVVVVVSGHGTDTVKAVGN